MSKPSPILPASPTVADLVASLRELEASSGAATEEDLARMGWRSADVKRLLPAARARLGIVSSRAA